MKRCVLSFATNDRKYPAGIRRIGDTLDKLGFDGDFVYWIVGKEYPVGCPTHQESKYGFKPWSLKYAMEHGYDSAVFADSSIIFNDIDKLFRIVERKGYYLFRASGQSVKEKKAGVKISDVALARLGVSRERALEMVQINTAVVGLDFANESAKRFLGEWFERGMDGVTFKGYLGEPSCEKDMKVLRNVDGFSSDDPRVTGHRHEQSAASVIAHKNSMNVAEHDECLFRFGRALVKDRTFAKQARKTVSRYVSRIGRILHA